MRKLFILTLLLLFTGIAFGQTLQKGAVLAIRNSTGLVLKPDVSMNQYLEAVTNKWAPEFEKLFPDTKLMVMKGDRGEMANTYAWVWFFPSEAVRDKYFTAEGAMKDQTLLEQMEKLNEILTDYAIDPGMTSFTDWIVL